MKNIIILPVLLFFAVCCAKAEQEDSPQTEYEIPRLDKREVARILSALPIGNEQLQEVHDAVDASSGNGYDEEYTMKDLFESPGSGVGDDHAKSSSGKYGTPMRDLFEDYFARNATTKASSAAQACLQALKESDLQIYWPYSEDWDGETFPLVTFDPGYGAESNYAYEIRMGEEGPEVVDSVFVDENVARKRPVWVVNSNTDSAFSPLDLLRRDVPATKSKSRMLMLKSLTMLRNYDSWFAGASEFNIQCGSVEGFKAKTESELSMYYPTITNFTIVVKRKQLNKELPLDIVLMTDFTSQLDKLAFLVTEDDGGTSTSWKCSAVVKVASKSYGFEVELPFNDKDDIVWRGQLSAGFFQEEDVVTGRFGDVRISFELL